MQKIRCIDFHAHIFPDTLAPKAIASLVEGGKHLYLPNTDGTKDGLIKFMDESGVDISKYPHGDFSALAEFLRSLN